MMVGLHNLGKIVAGLLTVAIVSTLPSRAHAESLVFRNDAKEPVILQAACVVRGVFRRDRPYLLKPGDSTPGIVMPGNKVITIYEGRHPNKIIFKGAIPGGLTDQLFSVNPDPTGGVRVDLAPTPKSEK